MSMYNDIEWELGKTNAYVWRMHLWLLLQGSSLGHWSFHGPGSETKWNAIETFKPGGERDRVAELMMNNLRESGHLVFRATSALDRGQLKSKEG